MAGTAASRGEEERRARALESNTQSQGRSGSETLVKPGPATKRGILPTNATMGGGINRSLRGMK